jgi:hypothetical protein
LFFVTTVTDSSNTAIENATVTVDCVDAHDGAQLADMAVTDSSGRASPVARAPNRACPADRITNSSFFRSCTLTVSAAGFGEESLMLSGADLDALPPSDEGEAGVGVRVTVVLTPS